VVGVMPLKITGIDWDATALGTPLRLDERTCCNHLGDCASGCLFVACALHGPALDTTEPVLNLGLVLLISTLARCLEFFCMQLSPTS